MSTPAVLSSHRRAVFAARFLRPPGKFARARLREKPRLRTGPFENPVRRFVRLREKARAFCEIPPPRRVPIPKPINPLQKLLKPIEGVPTVRPEVLQRRLDHLLSQRAIDQQLTAPLRPGTDPYSTEMYCWDRQMRDLRKIYRAQYLQKLAEVTEEERAKQLKLFQAERKERRARREAFRQQLFEKRKKKAILKDRLRIEAKVTEAIELTRQSRVKQKHLWWLDSLQKTADFVTDSETAEEKITRRKDWPDRNVSAPDILRQLGESDEVVKSPKKAIRADNVFRELLEESFAILPEDEPQYEPEPPPEGRLTHRQRAHVMYGGFSEAEKLKLLDDKIDLLKHKLAVDADLKGASHSLLYQQLLDQLEATKQAYLEKQHSQEARDRAAAARGSVDGEDTGDAKG